jgi:hypothetical protein
MEIREALLHRIGVLEDELTLIRQTLANALAQRSPARHDACEMPLATLHRVWRQVSPDDRARFLIEMLTPAERRLVATGLGPDEEDAPHA